MSKKRNISGGPLDVPLLDRVVEADEVVDVPDFQPASTPEEPLPILWPPDKWEPVPDAPPAPPKAAVPEPEPDVEPDVPDVQPPPFISSDPRERR